MEHLKAVFIGSLSFLLLGNLFSEKKLFIIFMEEDFKLKTVY